MITVPPSFLGMPRWWRDAAGREWLDRLPELVDEVCVRWRMRVDGSPMHGSNALVVPVLREREAFALRLTPPGDDVAAEAHALRFWDGRGTVRLFDGDEERGAMVLERLDGSRTLGAEPILPAIEVLAELTRMLAIPATSDIRSTKDIAAELLVAATSTAADTEACPVSDRELRRVIEFAAQRAGAPIADTAVDGDLHFEQVLAGLRMPWIVVDPVLLRGDPEYDLGRVLWSRLDELPGDDDVIRAFDRFVRVAQVPTERARAWVVLRSFSYLTWGIENGLTEDPVRCRRLISLFC